MFFAMFFWSDVFAMFLFQRKEHATFRNFPDSLCENTVWKPQYRYEVHGKEAVFMEAEFSFLFSLKFEIISLNTTVNRNELFLATS